MEACLLLLLRLVLVLVLPSRHCSSVCGHVWIVAVVAAEIAPVFLCRQVKGRPCFGRIPSILSFRRRRCRRDRRCRQGKVCYANERIFG